MLLLLFIGFIYLGSHYLVTQLLSGYISIMIEHLLLAFIAIAIVLCVNSIHNQKVSLNEWSLKTSPACAPGFDGHPCECKAAAYQGLLKCEKKRAYVIRGFWVGECGNGTLCTGSCPFGFCLYNNSKHYRLPGTVSELDEYICGDTRTGVLCGDCQTGYSVSYHSYSFTCTPDDNCRYGWLFYIVSELLPLIAVFIIITFVNVSFTCGAVSSFILFAQLQDSLAVYGNELIYSSFNQYFISIAKLIYRFFNFEFFSIEELSFCLWKGATVLDALAFKYVTILFGLILIVIYVYLVNSSRIKRYLPCLRPTTLRSSLIHGLSAFFVMCYSQCARVSLGILTPVQLYKNNNLYEKTVVFLSGNLSMFEPVHLRYAIPAVFFTTTLLLLPPIILTVFPVLGKILSCCNMSEAKCANCISQCIPIQLLDSFQSSFKDEFRFFAGFYFLYRLIVLVTFLFCQNLSDFYCILEILLVFILSLHAIVQPHKKWLHNVMDVLTFADLAIINAFSLLHYYKVILQKVNIVNTFVSYTQLVLIYLPLVCLLIAGLVKAWKLVAAHFKKDSPETRELLNSNTLPSLREH